MKYKICRDIEKSLDLEIESSSEFEMLSDKIQESTKVYISPTTLKRMWGYLKEDVNPRKSTLNILARFLGYKNYNAYQKGNASPQSGIVEERKISSREMVPGQMLRLLWAPDRQCIVVYQGDGRFRVEESVNTKLQPGDTFFCLLIIEREPVYMDNLCREGADLGSYVAGRRDGVAFTLL